MSIALNQKVKELERRIEQLESEFNQLWEAIGVVLARTDTKVGQEQAAPRQKGWPLGKPRKPRDAVHE